MFRSLMVLLTVGFVGVAVASLVFSVLIPLLAIALKIAVVAVIGYFILRMVKPGMADDLKRKVRREDS